MKLRSSLHVANSYKIVFILLIKNLISLKKLVHLEISVRLRLLFERKPYSIQYSV